VLAAIAAGGFLGALARYELGLAWPTAAGHFPWTTFTINVSGGFLLGVLLTSLGARPSRYLRPFLGVGVLGAWTTMSTFAVEADLLVRGGHLLTSVGYIVATVMVGVTGTAVGVALTRRLAWTSG
jgi:CrcB protein